MKSLLYKGISNSALLGFLFGVQTVQAIVAGDILWSVIGGIASAISISNAVEFYQAFKASGETDSSRNKE